VPRHHLLRRLIATVGILAIGLFAAATLFGAVPGMQDPSAPEARATATGAFTQSNSRENQAIFSTAAMAPGESTTGTVTIGNTGTLSGALTLAAREPSDSPGTYGGVLSDVLDLQIGDITSGGSEEIYSGKLSGMPDQLLGTMQGGAARTYRFTVSMPDAGGPGEVWNGDNVYQRATTSVGYEWTLTEDTTTPPNPEEPPSPIATPSAQSPPPEFACRTALIGTGRADLLVGTDASDRIAGLRGRDSLVGGNGDDCINGGGGNDRIYGDDGSDSVRGGQGADRVQAGAGDDFIYSADKARDQVNCGPGSDSAFTDPRDVVRGCEHVARG
jgi:Ca2+-binding RTX toxin-like protein